jgi:hypothetical protein
VLLVVSAHTNETGMEEAIGPGFCGTSENYFNANFYEKAQNANFAITEFSEIRPQSIATRHVSLSIWTCINGHVDHGL